MSFIAHSIKERMPWEIGNRLLKAHGLPRGQGWIKTSEKLEEWIKAEQGAAAQQMSAFEAAYEDHVLCGEKCVWIYDVTSEDYSFDHVAVADSTYAQNYPYSLSAADLAAVETISPILCAVIEREGGTGFVFARKGVVQFKERINAAQFQNEDGFISTFSEVYGLRNSYKQYFDIVWVGADGYAEVRMDYPKNILIDEVVVAQNAVVSAFNAVLGQKILKEPIDLFPAIRALYDAPNEGKVVEMAFGTTTASTKHEKMNLRRSGDCLRDEIFHQGGIQAVNGDIDPYMICINWSLEVGGIFSSPELVISSTSRALHLGLPVFHAAIRKCVGTSDYMFVRNKLLTYAISDEAE